MWSCKATWQTKTIISLLILFFYIMSLLMLFLQDISLQTRTKLRISFNSILNSFRLRIVFKNQRKVANVFWLPNCLPVNLVAGKVYKYTGRRCNFSYYDDTNMHSNVSSKEDNGMLLLTFRKLSHQKRVQFETNLQ